MASFTRAGRDCRHRLRIRGTLRLEPLLCFAQPRAAPRRGRKFRRQLVTSPIPVELVLSRVNRLGLLEDLARKLLVIAVRVMRRVRMHLRPIDREHPDPRQTGVRAQRQDLAEEASDRVLVTLTKARDRRVIGALVRHDHAIGDILDALALDHPRRTLPTAIGVEQQRDHHLRIVRRAAHTIRVVGPIERVQIHVLDRRQQEPREMTRRQPIPQIRRKQQLLITIKGNEVLGHPGIVLNPPDTTNYATATARCDTLVPRCIGG